MDKDKDKKIEADEVTSVGFPGKNHEVISFFENDVDFIFVFKKTEKLATAIYMVTNLFSDNEPVKWTLRKKMGEVLNFVLDYKTIVSSRRKDFSDNLKTKVLEIVSLLQIASKSGLLSFMNFSILEQEFAGLIKTIDSQDILNKEFQTNNLSKSFFNVPKLEPKPRTDDQEIDSNRRYDSSLMSSRVQSDSIKDTNIIKDKSQFKRTNRQDMIIALLKKKSNLNIKDIALVVKGCSEKTIQRELISLISLGIVKKTGERRWSKYSMNKL